MIKEAKVRRAPRATKVTKEAKAPKGNPPLQCYMAARTRPKEARSKYPCPFYFTSIFTSSTPPPTADTPSTTPLVIPASPVAGLLHLFTQGFSHSSFRPVRHPSCIHSLVSHFPALPSGSTGPIVPSWSFRPSRSWVSTFFAAGISPVIPARPIPGLIIFTLPPHTSSPFITFLHISSHLITFHHSLTSTLSIVCSPSIAFFTTSYPAGHSGPLGTSFPTLIYPTLTRLPTVSR